MQETTLGAGCFWCVEAVFKNLVGVVSVEPGYANGDTDNPTYKAVCTGQTGHAEVCRIVFDPNQIAFKELLEVFWQTHDPTTLNQQGNDVGSQYRSAIFFHSAEQKAIALTMKQRLAESNVWPNPIVTEITELKRYYPAEDYHRDYFANNPDQGYCSVVIRPKVEKFRKAFADKIQPGK